MGIYRYSDARAFSRRAKVQRALKNSSATRGGCNGALLWPAPPRVCVCVCVCVCVFVCVCVCVCVCVKRFACAEQRCFCPMFRLIHCVLGRVPLRRCRSNWRCNDQQPQRPLACVMYPVSRGYASTCRCQHKTHVTQTPWKPQVAVGGDAI